ncbi:putative E3 ubiquitin-protein ligase UNKL [Schistocerca americana]|uniref:putative E3 ubiquitin-protein ligase UNKL n=1 Tax=Schistocerca americana TaxID=7009 RepID=UPI001F4F7900|nr:putative E3 ubiquitin-protein ligase UNKL [Schistocerca americana]XP_047108659.1 putative E3 ubiquitin-protein ligase UNKL [Schistocerca piceifrons]XP_049948460.1 putative E3 ubiquitin-protein ligase UNKL [Schistocerca serialis cubense]
MQSESKTLLTTPTEKPNHYSYLKEFRVEQCPLFLQHKCTQHRPFTCFHWHFMNQRRRRPVRRRDGTFNYSADNYCTKFDETTGQCPEGDDCQFLHRTAGDTERRYHLRYYKTCMCVHDTDSRGFCVKNGPHCAFAHGNHDLRPPVYDINELKLLEHPESDPSVISNGPNALDKERNLMNEDPKWQDTSYVLANYKTELCKRPPRLCRQGYACPQYHNSRDKRRSPRKFKYRSTPCPSVKHGDEWGEPSNCDNGDQCAYCHTRTEQQFHPEIYKSTKCNDVQTAGYCPRGVFCAFAHVEQEMSLARDLVARVDSGMSLADILSSALPSEKSSNGHDSCKRDEKSSDSSNGSGEVSESASTSSAGSNSSHSKAPGAQLAHHKMGMSSIFSSTQHETFQETSAMQNKLIAIERDPLLTPMEKANRKQNIYLNYSISNSIPLPSVSPLATPFYPAADTVESVVGNALEDLTLDEPFSLTASLDKDLEAESPLSISAGLASSGVLGSSAPVNIPGSTLNSRSSLGNFSPSTSSPLQQLQSSFLSAARFSHQDSLDSGSSFLNPPTMTLSSSASKINSFGSSSLFDFTTHQNTSPSSRGNLSSSLIGSFPLSSSMGNSISNDVHMQRLCEELASSRSKLASWDERIAQARTACEAWQRESEESNRKASIAEQQRDEALSQAKALQKEVDLLQGSPYLHGLRRVSELKSLSLATLKSLEGQLRSDLEEIEKVIYLQTATKCMVCEEGNRSITLKPCNHFVLCSNCALTQKECPYCQMPISNTPV